MNIDGISLTPRVLFWAYRMFEHKRWEAKHMRAVAQTIEKRIKYSASRAYYYGLMKRVATRLDRILGAME